MSLASLRILESKTIPVASPVSFGILNWKIIISLETGGHYQHRHYRSLIVDRGQDKTSQQHFDSHRTPDYSLPNLSPRKD